jgi:hypothetical protein
MVAASILPVTWKDGELHFLFGKENELEDSAKGFSDFGGGVESGESIRETAFREGAEELCGFLGDAASVKRLVHSCGGLFPIVHHHTGKDGKPTTYTMHIFFMAYDPCMTDYYNRQHKFLWNRMDKHALNRSKLFEKQEIRWFSASSLRRPSVLKLFRGFYRENVKKLLASLPEISRFIRSKRHTRAKHQTRHTRLAKARTRRRL